MDNLNLTPVLIVVILASLLKPFLELKVRPTRDDGTPNPVHDSLIRVFALALGIVVTVVDLLVHTGAAHLDGVRLESAVGAGFLAGVGAIVIYHITSSNFFDGAGLSDLSAPLTAPPALRGATGVYLPGGTRPAATLAVGTPAAATNAGLPPTLVPQTNPAPPPEGIVEEGQTAPDAL